MSDHEKPQKIQALLGRLEDLHNDPESFAKTKQLLIDLYIESLPKERQLQARSFQADIDVLGATSGTPMRAVNTFMDEMVFRCDSMNGFNKQLITRIQKES